MARTETLLMALALGLYLYDSALLLYSNEAVLVCARHNRWLAGFGSNRTTLRGRQLYLPNPLTPTRPVYRLSWTLEATADLPAHSAPPAANTAAVAPLAVNPGGDWTANRPLLRRLAPLVWSLAAALFIALPVALYGRLGDWLIVCAFGLVYTNLVVMLALLWLVRKRFNLTGRAFAQLAFDLVLCPPFALNLVRKLSLQVIVKEDFANAAKRLQQAPEWQLTQAELLARLDDEIASEEDGSAPQSAMRSRRTGIAGS